MLTKILKGALRNGVYLHIQFCFTKYSPSLLLLLVFLNDALKEAIISTY